MLRRTLTNERLNIIANLPEILPLIGGKPGEELDLTPLVANPRNFTLEADGVGGGFILQRMDEAGTYELHTLFPPGEARGKAFFSHAREMFRFMFTRTDCVEIVTKCPDNNDGARMAANIVGMRERFRREDAWAEGVGISYRVFSVDDWLIRDGEVRRVGREFHDVIEAAKKAAGSELPVHAEDEAHDRAVGAALLMSWGGYFLKGVGFYNRWARLAGYAEIQPVNDLLVDIQDGIVALQGGRAEVLLLR
jgi:hypothetical protein